MVSGCYQTSAPTPTPGGGNQVTIKDFAFNPQEITIKVGDTVTWTQQDSTQHTTTGDIWNSGNLKQEQTYSKTFDKAGAYDYICTIHPNMKGKVIVE
jgi:amicyanin